MLRRVEQEGAYASVLLATQDRKLSSEDRSLTYILTTGVLRWQTYLDHLISHFGNRDAARLDLAVRISLRMGLYQLRFLKGIPESAAVNEAVKLVRFARIRSADKFVNAVLRRAIRESDYDPLTVISDPLERISVETSHPRWLIERWSKEFGPEDARAFALTNNSPPPQSFRVAPHHDSDEILTKLRIVKASLEPSRIVANAWRVSGGKRVKNLVQQLALDGQIYLQDEASQLVAHVVGAKHGDLVLDLCSAPGSKTTHIASLADFKATVVAGDLYRHRLRFVADAAQLQRIPGINCIVLDGEQSLPFAKARFDRVLVDAPCSGTGTLRRNPEIRYRISPGDIQELSGRQYRLLMNAAQAVKPGGRLVYSTCSVEVEENEQVAAAFLRANNSFDRIQVPVPPELLTESGAARMWPHVQGSDGFFITAFERKS